MDMQPDGPRETDAPAYQPSPDGEDVFDLGREYRVKSEEADFTGDPGTTDVMAAVEDGETYFPPTDPVVVLTNDTLEGLEMRGGVAETALDEPRAGHRDPARLQYNDEELAEAVIRALRNDAYTMDLDVEAAVVEGVVYLRGRVNSIEDVEQAEEVAGSVDGVVDVEEELEIV